MDDENTDLPLLMLMKASPRLCANSLALSRLRQWPENCPQNSASRSLSGDQQTPYISRRSCSARPNGSAVHKDSQNLIKSWCVQRLERVHPHHLAFQEHVIGGSAMLEFQGLSIGFNTRKPFVPALLFFAVLRRWAELGSKWLTQRRGWGYYAANGSGHLRV